MICPLLFLIYKRHVLISCCIVSVRSPCTAEKVTGNLTQLTGRVAPRDVSSVHSIRKAMGVAVPPEELPEPLIDLTTGTSPHSFTPH